MISLTPPHNLTLNHIHKFIEDSSKYFSYENSQTPNFILDLRHIEKISLIGQLILYKFISFTVEKRCFFNPKINGLEDNEYLYTELEKNGFLDIINAYIRNAKEKELIRQYRKLKIINENNLILAPQKLLRYEMSDRKTLEEEYFSKLLGFYGNNVKSRTICLCIGELINNFYSHATNDTGTIMVAKGNHSFIDICFADTGNGIINTLRDSNKKYLKYSKTKIMKLAVSKNVTSKPGTAHLGMGLFLIAKVAEFDSEGTFRIISDEVEFRQENKKTARIIESSFWKGTITYLHLSIDKMISIDKIKELHTPAANKLKFI